MKKPLDDERGLLFPRGNERGNGGCFPGETDLGASEKGRLSFPLNCGIRHTIASQR